jgi:phosphoribosylglycinamide formyltransferase-1
VTNLAIFASGKGSNFRAIHKKVLEGYLPCNIPLLISDKSKAGALEYAEQYGIARHVVPPKQFESAEVFGTKLIEILTGYQVDYIALAGYLKMVPGNVVSFYESRILNIHPALLPAFGGKGMYGMRVHEAVFKSGARYSGVTVHFVNNEYDCGPILLQKVVEIKNCRTPEEIAHKVLKQEHKVYSDALKILLEKKFRIKGKRVFYND